MEELFRVWDERFRETYGPLPAHVQELLARFRVRRLRPTLVPGFARLHGRSAATSLYSGRSTASPAEAPSFEKAVDAFDGIDPGLDDDIYAVDASPRRTSTRRPDLPPAACLPPRKRSMLHASRNGGPAVSTF